MQRAAATLQSASNSSDICYPSQKANPLWVPKDSGLTVKVPLRFGAAAGEPPRAPRPRRAVQLSQAGARPRRNAPSSEKRPAPVKATASAAAPSTATNS